MIDYLSDLFDDFLFEAGFKKKIESITFVVKNLIYTKKNIQLVLTCELTEWAFDFEIRYSDNRGTHSIAEVANRKRTHYQNVGCNMIYHSIFEYTRSEWSKENFQLEKEHLLHKKYGVDRTRKYFYEVACLYKKLLCTALRNINTGDGSVC